MEAAQHAQQGLRDRQQLIKLEESIAIATMGAQEAQTAKATAERIARDYKRQLQRMKASSAKRLAAKRLLKDRVDELKNEIDELRHASSQVSGSLQEEEESATAKLKMMPTWRRSRYGYGTKGGGLRLEHQHRVAILEQHANGTPPSAIARNITSIVKAAAPWLNPVEPTVGDMLGR